MNKSGVPIYIKLSTSKLLSSPSPFFSTTRRNLLQSFHAGLASFLLFYLLTNNLLSGFTASHDLLQELLCIFFLLFRSLGLLSFFQPIISSDKSFNGHQSDTYWSQSGFHCKSDRLCSGHCDISEAGKGKGHSLERGESGFRSFGKSKN